mmetsp:Transcript_39280/g.51400  ORF Transcript_39280/g.51400 Transcript_39280/m.51400 type:complete len:202 (-) Transcript_39280:245-850(-)
MRLRLLVKPVVPDSLLRFESLSVLAVLPLELLVPQSLLILQFLAVALLDLRKFVLVPSVQTSIFVDLCLDVATVSRFDLLSLLEPGLLLLVHIFAELGVFVQATGQLSVGALLLFTQLVKVEFLRVSCLPFLLLNLVLQLLDLLLKLLLETLLHLCVLLEAISSRCDGYLELLTCRFALPNKGLVLLNIFLEVVKHLQLIV